MFNLLVYWWRKSGEKAWKMITRVTILDRNAQRLQQMNVEMDSAFSWSISSWKKQSKGASWLPNTESRLVDLFRQSKALWLSAFNLVFKLLCSVLYMSGTSSWLERISYTYNLSLQPEPGPCSRSGIWLQHPGWDSTLACIETTNLVLSVCLPSSSSWGNFPASSRKWMVCEN